MTTNFDWQTDEDESTWQTPPVPTEPQRPRPAWQGRSIILILIALSIAGYVIFQRAEKRIDDATAAITADLFSSYRLVYQAALEGDEDLFLALLSGRNPGWTDTQKALVEANIFLDRPSFGFRALPLDLPVDDDAISDNMILSHDFSPDLTEAELVTVQPYEIIQPDGRVNSVTLAQTAVYRLGSTRWLLAPPQDEFWGPTHTNTNDLLIVVYPDRDEAIVRRLAGDLETLLLEACKTINDLNCPADLQVTLAFSKDPTTLLNLANRTHLWQGGLRITLPTPTLVGLPLDEAGYEAGYNALYQGYAAQLVTAVITELVEWECCAGAPIYQVLLQYQLHQLGLAPWPLDQIDYQRVLEENIPLFVIGRYWHQDTLDGVAAEERWLIYMVVDFLQKSAPSISPALAQRAMRGTNSFTTWLRSLVLEDDDDPNINQKWQMTAYLQTQISSDPPPIALPSQDIQLLCTSLTQVADIELSLYRHPLNSEEWPIEATWSEFVFIVPSPDDTTLVVQQYSGDEEQWQTTLWQDAEQMYTLSNELTLSFGQFYPVDQHLIAYGAGTDLSSTIFQLVDLTQCETDGCLTHSLPGLLSWSPDGSQAIFTEVEENDFSWSPLSSNNRLINLDSSGIATIDLFRNEEPGQPLPTNESLIPIGRGYHPFWLDNETYGYITSASEDNQYIRVATIQDDTPETLIDDTTLFAAIPDDQKPRQLRIDHAIPHPANPDLLIITASEQTSGLPANTYLFTFQESSHQLRFLHNLITPNAYELGFSPDPRWLTVITHNPQSFPENTGTMLLFNLENGQSQSFVTFPNFSILHALYDWSHDGQWLAVIVDSNAVALIAPEHNYYQLIQHDLDDCLTVAWVNPIE